VLANGDFVTVQATNVYGIPTEPWIFVVGASGKIVASFEAVVAPDELAAAIKAAKSG
jgi:glutathione peroxidase-family protein